MRVSVTIGVKAMATGSSRPCATSARPTPSAPVGATGLAGWGAAFGQVMAMSPNATTIANTIPPSAPSQRFGCIPILLLGRAFDDHDGHIVKHVRIAHVLV